MPPGQSSQAHISMLYPKQALLRYSPPTSPLVHLDMYPPSNPVPTLPNACGASVQRVSSLKARQQGQRHEINPKMLGGIHPSRFYKDELLEPVLGTPEADALLEQIRRVALHDPRFAPGDPSSADTTAAENADRDTQSIYKMDQSGRALGHVRSDINHRPYHCTCDKCRNGNNPRKFFSDNWLDDHLKVQTHK
ncbi:hypothetical protein PIIN_11565 [Serendipita indica DSM 11827]|uniref:Uncharacterized protein n=1 Tax=Serendipita indica (strain DSM 11827) TaxID=1109443 RepID=G4U1Z5_SERID|nr:hypothetical protein PIIN_11565 [Serendipita indica DSM 11827]